MYDYFLVSRELSACVYDVAVVADRYFSPHSPVRLLLRAAPRAMKVKELRGPRGIPAVLPFGPPTAEHVEDANVARDIATAQTVRELQVDVEFPKLVSLVEKQLTGFLSVSGQERQAYLGREHGPRSDGGLQCATRPASRAAPKSPRFGL